MGLTEAARSDDRLRALKTLRDSLAADLDACASMRDKAALSQRFMDVLEQIDALTTTRGRRRKTGLSEFERRLREREDLTTNQRSEGNAS
jgi:hypothetical protein